MFSFAEFPSLPSVLSMPFAEAPAWLQGVLVGLATFLQEDLPTVTAALLVHAGRMPWAAGLLGSALGIWVGDLLLYAAARHWGRPLLQWRWFQRRITPESLARSEDWFKQKGIGLLWASRFIPGTRLPTYLAAGFLGVPFRSFAGVTGLAVAVWTGGIFLLAHLLGPRLTELLGRWDRMALTVLGLVSIGVLGRAFLGPARLPDGGRAVAARWRSKVQRGLARWERWRHWEFWPAWLFYLPVAVQYLRLSIRHGSLTLPSAANPGIFTGGLVGESKLATLHDLLETSPEFTAPSWSLDPGPIERRLQQLDALLQNPDLGFPFILKPDIGQRGLGVKRIAHRSEAIAYLQQTSEPLIVQRYVPGPWEVGIFYLRHPGESRGRIFAITEKVFPVVIGDGRTRLEELIWQDPRARLLASTYLGRLGERQHRIPAHGEQVRLVEAGNHAQGCIFRDGRHFLTPDLEARIDAISQKLTGFYIGRYDLRFESEEALRAGRGFQILELNGAAAEATHIYDARRSLASAYRSLFEQWEHVFRIGAANRERGVVPLPPVELWRLWREARMRFATYPLAD